MPGRVPLGHWAGDRVLIVDEYAGRAQDYLPADLIAEYPDAETDEILEFALANLKHIALPEYTHQGANDTLFPIESVWVVRNLTKKWYARSDVLIEEAYRRGPDISGGVGLGHFIWGGIGGAIQGNGGGCTGERIDIQPLSVVENSADSTLWTDLSNKARGVLSEFEMYHDQYLD
jgi:hypothetical protein